MSALRPKADIKTVVSERPLIADTVEKVENLKTLIFRQEAFTL